MLGTSTHRELFISGINFWVRLLIVKLEKFEDNENFGKSMENQWKCSILGFKWGFSLIFRKIPRLQTSLASRNFRVWENLNMLGPSTLRELSIAHSFGVVPPTHPRAKLRGRCRIFGIFGFGDLGTKNDLFLIILLSKDCLQPQNPTLLPIKF